MLTQAQIDRFHADGFLVMPGLFGGRELDLLREAVDRVQAQGVARHGANHRYLPAPDGSQVYWRSEECWARADIFKAVTVHPDLLENIGQCVGQAFYPWNDSLVVKLAHHGAAVDWHQDPPYGTPFAARKRQTTFAVPNFTTDFYLDHSDPDNGCVYAIPGHHLVGTVDLAGKTHERLIAECGAVPVVMRPGDVLFHCLSTPHGSGPNRSARQRRIFYVHYLAQDVYDDGYAPEPWAKDKPGWNDARRRTLEAMLDARKTLGLGDARQRPSLRFTADGIDFTGSPKTPRRHWATLAAQIPPDTAAAMKRLERAAVRA